MGNGLRKSATVKMEKYHEVNSLRDSIMVVEDDFQLRKMLTDIFIDEGYEVRPVENAERAMSFVHEGFNLILTDVVMPGESGLKLLEKVRRSCPETEFIIMTALPGVNTAVEAIKSGAFDYLSKPFELEVIRQKVKKAIARSHTSKSNRNHQRELGGYGLVKMLGEGSMGIVYLVECLKEPEQKFAMKIIKERFLKREMSEYKDRFQKEAETSCKLIHPNITRVFTHGFSEDTNTPFMVMEVVDGTTLKAIIQSQKEIEIEAKAKIIIQIAEALEYAHNLNIIHRDIKPDNIMVDSKGNAKLSDFGVVQLLESEQTNLHKIIGTPNYLAPEAFKCPKVSRQADIYSLGAVAYELFLGVKTFDIESIQVLGFKVQTENPQDPCKINSKFPRSLQRILERMLKKDIKQRYQTAKEVATDLKFTLKNGFQKKRIFSIRHWNTLR